MAVDEKLITQTLINQVVQLTRQASEAILAVYHDESAFEVNIKSDQSPVTLADIAAHNILLKGLRDLLPDIPVLSEESEIPEYSIRQQWQRYWLIDPLDGTKEFIQRNDEFTVNVALIEDGQAILGVVTVPTTGVVYWGAKGRGAFKVDSGKAVSLSTRSMESRLDNHLSIDVMGSRRHGNEMMATVTKGLAAYFPKIEYQSIGSSLKMCLIAEGKADIYPRFALTSEWDTAAAQAVVEAAGGSIVDLSFMPLRYNQKNALLNPYFLVLADPSYSWSTLLEPYL